MLKYPEINIYHFKKLSLIRNMKDSLLDLCQFYA